MQWINMHTDKNVQINSTLLECMYYPIVQGTLSTFVTNELYSVSEF
jgi:hypothetical protein